jgi:hypothetical protein
MTDSDREIERSDKVDGRLHGATRTFRAKYGNRYGDENYLL